MHLRDASPNQPRLIRVPMLESRDPARSRGRPRLVTAMNAAPSYPPGQPLPPRSVTKRNPWQVACEPGLAGIHGRDQSHARSTFSVVGTGNKPRTQNGHIRNDTRDVLRRIPAPSNGAICRRKCVASERACTPVTLPNFHGKEGVDGSSPSEGYAKAPHNGAFCFGSSCRFSNVGQVWSPLWSLQVVNALLGSSARLVGTFS